MLVYEIGESAFGYKNLTSVVLPNSIKTIRKYAFADNNLNKITLSETIERIGEHSFESEYYNNNNNKYLMDKWIVPDTLTYIGNSYIFVKELVVNMEIIPESAFIGSDIHKLTLGNKVKVIGQSAFSYNSLDELIIPNSVTTIGASAFKDNFIKELTIPDSVITIGRWSFSQNNITEIHLGKNIETIDEGAFEIGYGLDYNKYANNVNSNTDLKTIYLGNKNQRDFDWENIIDGFHKTSYYKQIKYVLPE